MMTFKQYCNQNDPQRQPTGSVIVNIKDCSSRIEFNGDIRVGLLIGGELYSYTTKINPEYPKEPTNLLFTMDEDGNPIKGSVFTLYNPEYFKNNKKELS